MSNLANGHEISDDEEELLEFDVLVAHLKSLEDLAKNPNLCLTYTTLKEKLILTAPQPCIFASKPVTQNQEAAEKVTFTKASPF